MFAVIDRHAPPSEISTASNSAGIQERIGLTTASGTVRMQTENAMHSIVLRNAALRIVHS